tara:strand:+ start:669 stop:872 length:204 start_codon:yes stop_codon:yes gene_type:complete
MAMDILNPRKSVIVEMIMVQLISLCLIVLAVMLFKSKDLSSTTISYMLIGAFFSATLAGTIYTRLSR